MILYAYVTFGAFPEALVGRCSNEFGIHDRVGPRRRGGLTEFNVVVILLLLALDEMVCLLRPEAIRLI